jgi:hypothetical protein
MSDKDRKPAERYYDYHLRTVMLGLLLVVGLGVYNLIRVFGAGNERLGMAVPAIIVAVAIIALITLELVTLRGRRWRRRDPEVQAILRDEWRLTNVNRGYRVAFWVMLCAQWPLMPIMAYVPVHPERSVVGMGIGTALLGLGAFLASYLYFSRQPGDG